MARRPVSEVIAALLGRGPTVRSSEVARGAGASRQAAQRHLRRLVAQGKLVPEGKGRVAHYRRAPATARRFRYPCAVLDEERVWRELHGRVPALRSLPEDTAAVFQYAFTEMLNNAIDHSESTEVAIAFEPTEHSLAFEIVDEGVGLFDKLRRAFGLGSNLEALQELSKGKVTTQPERHTGEGIFFTSKVADYFEADSGGLRWMVDNDRADMSVTAGPARKGTRIRFEASRKLHRSLRDVFGAYTTDFRFTRTKMIVKLFASGSRFVSRSEARRLLHGLERFEEVLLDFGGVREVGQGFADEVFRVWARAHPKTRLVPARMNAAVGFMVQRGLPAPPAGKGARQRRRR